MLQRVEVVRGAVAALAFCAAGAVHADISNSYVTNGLVVWFDGIDNAGIGVHSASPGNWADLTGLGNDGTIVKTDIVWGDTGWSNSADGTPIRIETDVVRNAMKSRNFTIDFATTPSRSNARQAFYSHWQSSGSSIEHNSGKVSSGAIRVYFSGNPDWTSDVMVSAGEAAALSVVATQNARNIFKNGSLAGTDATSITASDAEISPDKASIVGGDPGRANMAFRGTYHAFRCYNRALSADEVAINAASDQVRLFGADAADVTLPDGYAFDEQANVLFNISAAATDGDGFVSIDGGAASQEVTSGYALLNSATNVTLTATSAAGKEFSYWSGDIWAITSGSVDSPSITVSGDKHLHLVANYETSSWYWTGGANESEPKWFTYANWEDSSGNAPTAFKSGDKFTFGQADAVTVNYNPADDTFAFDRIKFAPEGGAVNVVGENILTVSSIVCQNGQVNIFSNEVAFTESINLTQSSGTVIFSGGVTSMSSVSLELVHRWSFNGDYTDSIGGTTATLIGSDLSFDESNRAVVMFGSGNGAGSLNLGTDMIPTNVAEVTVEIWATQTEVKNWARMIDYGSDNQNYFMAAWNQGTDANRDKVEIRKANATILVSDTTLSPFTLSTPYHFSFTFRAKEDGSSHVSWARRNTTSGEVEQAGDSLVPGWQLSTLVSPNFYIGHSQFSGDHDANAIYDEVRVWKGALTEAQLTASAIAGPDTLPDLSSSATSAETSKWTGKAGDGDAQNAGNWSNGVPGESTTALFSGDVAVQIPSTSPISCAGVRFYYARLTADCDWRGFSAMTTVTGGSLDLNGNKLYVSGLDGTGTITDTSPADSESGVGELHIDTASGVTSENTGVQVTGSLKIIKKGVGTYKATATHSNFGVGKFLQGTLDIAKNHFVVSDLDGSGTITSSSGNLLNNGDMQADTVVEGAYTVKSPRWWNYSGTVYVIKNNHEYGDTQSNGSNWCFLGSGATISQNFYLSEPSVCRVSLDLATANNETTYWKSNGNVALDGAAAISWTDLGWRTATKTANVSLSAGWHTISIYTTRNRGMLVDNVSVIVPNVLEVNVPNGVTSVNNEVAITGGANMQVWKSGLGTLCMKCENAGFGVSDRYSNVVSLRVREGVAKQTTSAGTASCGAQYATIQVDDGAQFDLCGRTYHDYDYVIEGFGPDGTGALVSSVAASSPWANDSSNRGYLQMLTLSGDATIGGPEAWAMLFYNRLAEGKVNMNGHTLTVKGVTLYGGNSSYIGSGKLVVASDATMEFVNDSPSAADCDVVVEGCLAQNGQALTPMKSLTFTETGRFNNQVSNESTPQFVVRETYGPNLAADEGSVATPSVQLGADGYAETTLDLSRFTAACDGTKIAFYPGSQVKVDLGARTFTEDSKVLSWDGIPDNVCFVPAGGAAEANQITVAARDDGIWVVALSADKPVTARWTGTGDASNLLDPANWQCYNRSGVLLEGSVPTEYTTVLVDAGTTTLSVPEGASAPWPKVVVGDGVHAATQWGCIFYGADRSAYSGTGYTDTPLGDYTALGEGNVNHVNEYNTAWTYSFLDWAQVRFDGWFYVTAEQAGSWNIDQMFDDYFGFAVDGTWVLLNNTYTVNTTATCEVSEGWHRFTIVCGDTYGGQGATNTGNVSMRIFINGAETPVTFSSLNFTMGSGQAVVKLGGDCDWSAINRVEFSNAPVIDMNGHSLTIETIILDDYIGAKITNSAAETGTLTIVVDEGDTYTLDGLTIDGNVKVVKSGAGTLVMSTAGSTYTGGTVVDAGTLKSGKAGSSRTIGTINLLKNGDFDEGTALNDRSGTWSYANKANFVLPYWSSSNTGRIGLAKRNTTWVANVDVGKYALFMQTTSSNAADVSQDMTVAAPGTYRYSFSYAARPEYTGAVTQLRLIHDGVTKTLESVTSSETSLTTVEGEVELDEAGVYTLQFYQPTTSGDKANVIDNVVFSLCMATAKAGAIQVNSGATFEAAGKYDFVYNSFVLNGGTVSNTGGDIGSGTAQMKYVFLTADSEFSFPNSYGLIGNSYSKTILDLGGHTLSVDIGSEKRFWLYNTEARNGTICLKSGGCLGVGNNGLAATDGVTLDAQGAALEINGAVDVQNYIARYNADEGTGTAAFKVYGTFTPATDYYYGCQLQNGATLDLSLQTGTFNTTSAVTKGATRVVTFADDATITLNLDGRTDLFDIARSDLPFVVTWDAEPENLSTLKFLTDSASKKAGFRIAPASETVTEGDASTTTYGIKIVYVGGSVLILR